MVIAAVINSDHDMKVPSETEELFTVLRQSAKQEPVSALEKLIKDAPDRELCRINALAFAAKHKLDEEDVIARAHELAQFVDDAAKEYKIDMNDLVAVGYSNGANIAAAMLLLGLAKYPEAILFRAMVPLSKIDVPNLKALRVFISAGRLDPIAQVPIAHRLAQLLESAGAKVTLQLQPGGHDLSPPDVTDAREWLAR